MVEVLREIDHGRDVTRLPSQRRPAAARQDRNVVLAADGDGRDDIVDAPRDHDADWHLPECRMISGVECAIAGGESDLTLDLPAKRLGEPTCFDVVRWSAGRPVD